MSWPKGRPRPRKVKMIQDAFIEVDRTTTEAIEEGACPGVVVGDEVAVQPPADWRKGALLNVRNHGAEYIITLWPEEYSPEREERAIKFTNLGLCQDFVSRWYAAEHHDPRAR